MASSGNDGGMIQGINVTPLVDITLVLLIIFIVTAKIIVTPAIPMDLPQAAHGSEVQVVLSLLVPKAGPMLVNGQAAPDEATLVRLVAQAAARDKEVRAVISADGAVPHRRVIHLLDVLKGAGLSHVAFGTLADEPAAEPGSGPENGAP